MRMSQYVVIWFHIQFVMAWHDTFTDILKGCFAGSDATVILPEDGNKPEVG